MLHSLAEIVNHALSYTSQPAADDLESSLGVCLSQDAMAKDVQVSAPLHRNWNCCSRALRTHAMTMEGERTPMWPTKAVFWQDKGSGLGRYCLSLLESLHDVGNVNTSCRPIRPNALPTRYRPSLLQRPAGVSWLATSRQNIRRAQSSLLSHAMTISALAAFGKDRLCNLSDGRTMLVSNHDLMLQYQSHSTDRDQRLARGLLHGHTSRLHVLLVLLMLLGLLEA